MNRAHETCGEFNARCEADRLARAIEYYERAKAATGERARYWARRSLALRKRRSMFDNKVRQRDRYRSACARGIGVRR